MAERGPASALLLGAQPVWDPPALDALSSAAKASLRAQLGPGAQQGGDRSPAPTPTGPRAAALPRRMAAAARAAADALPRRVGPPPPPPRPAPVRGRARRPDVGFLIASPIPRRDGWLIEQIVRGREAPNGTTELLLDTAIRALAGDGPATSPSGYPRSRGPCRNTRAPRGVRLLLAWMRVHAPPLLRLRGAGEVQAEVRAGELGARLRRHRPAAGLAAHPLRHRRRLRRHLAPPLRRPRVAARGGAGGEVGGGAGAANALIGQGALKGISWFCYALPAHQERFSSAAPGLRSPCDQVGGSRRLRRLCRPNPKRGGNASRHARGATNSDRARSLRRRNQ